jgi:hypothetical protein
MRFGFFFFAEYVNVFIVSALTATALLRRLERAVQLALASRSTLSTRVQRDTARLDRDRRDCRLRRHREFWASARPPRRRQDLEHEQLARARHADQRAGW